KRPIARNLGLRGIGYGISAILGIIFPYIVLKTDALGIVGGSFYDNLRFTFKMGYSNMAFGTIVGLNILGLCGFLFYYVTVGRHKKLHIRDLGLTPEKYDSMKTNGEKALSVVQMVVMTLLLSAIVIAISWGYIQLQEEVAGTAFYAYFFGVKEIPIAKIPYYLNYLVIWIICFVVASFTLNVERRLPSTGNDNLDTVLQMAINIVLGIFTLTLIVAVKWYLQTIGSDADTNLIWNMGLDTQRIWGMPVGMTVGIGGSTFLYKKTGNTWLSAILMGTVACLMCVLFGGTRFHFLTFFVS
ncbi:MAG: hypothetical protein LUF92_05000, partial [Clostridiales bacterium]|nr:hypothetical protein [Clostridiales bacterium]